VFPESVEAHLLAHPLVSEALVGARKSPITGAILTADIVLSEPLTANEAKARLRDHIAALPRAAQPAIMRFVESLPLNASGKKQRGNP
jgi:acyl-coenzyme A synthetase/AMP-(fatty) acid ligase